MFRRIDMRKFTIFTRIHAHARTHNIQRDRHIYTLTYISIPRTHTFVILLVCRFLLQIIELLSI